MYRLASALFSTLMIGMTLSQATFEIKVGSVASAPGGVFQYTPNSITARNGDMVSFAFTGAPGNHSVTQSSFEDPCNPLLGGFDSGWVFIPSTNVTHTPKFVITITDESKPIWFYCKQLLPSPHCNAGMVGVINANTSGNTIEEFARAAQNHSGPSGQGSGGSLSGLGATAPAPPGPIASGALAFGAPKDETTPISSNDATPLLAVGSITIAFTVLSIALHSS